jgi:hypothetical protein
MSRRGSPARDHARDEQIRVEGEAHRSGAALRAGAPRGLDLVLDLILGHGRQVQRIQPRQALGEPLGRRCASSRAARNSTKSTTSATRLGGSFFSRSIN